MTSPCIMLRTACGCVQYMVGEAFHIPPIIERLLPAPRRPFGAPDLSPDDWVKAAIVQRRTFEYAETLRPKDGPEIRVYEEVL